MKKIIFILFLLIIAGITAVNAAETQRILKIESNITGKANVYMKPSGSEQKYTLVAKSLPCEITPAGTSNQDIKIEKTVYFFFVLRGERKSVNLPRMFPLKIPVSKEMMPERMVAAFALPIVILLEIMRRKKQKESRELQKELSAANEEIIQVKAENSSFNMKILKKIGKYKIDKKIGDGGMASVYKAFDDDNNFYALKVPYERFFEHQIFLKRFEHEAIIGSKLIHKSIVKVFDYSTSVNPGPPFICMEYIDGDTLMSVMKKRPLQKTETAAKYIISILEALSYAHEKNIVHRDIKPANIMVCNNGNLKIMDFGVAKISDLSAVTATDTMLGTPLYTAPEQIDSKTADPRSDLYSVGIVFYEMLAGTPPFNDKDPIKVIMQKHTHKPPRPSQYNPDIPGDYERIIMKLINKEPSMRYGSCMEVLEELQKTNGEKE